LRYEKADTVLRIALDVRGAAVGFFWARVNAAAGRF